MRSGTYIAALGRQSFEPSAPAPSSSQQANERQRELIKAQNDVLATVGVCLRDGRRDGDKAADLMVENEVGLAVGAVDSTVTYLASWPLVGVRNRLQTYTAYAGSGYLDVLKVAWHHSSWAALFAGMPVHLVYQLSVLAKEYLQTKLMRRLASSPIFFDKKSQKFRRVELLCGIDRCLSFAAWFLIYPLWYHSNLQVLHLLPPSPVLPSWHSFLLFTPSSAISLPYLAGPLFSLATGKSLLYQLATSSFIHGFLIHSVSSKLQFTLYSWILNRLPAPNNGQKASALIDHATLDEDVLGEMMAVEIEMEPSLEDLAEPRRSTYTATIPFDPQTGEIIVPPPQVSTDPLELDETDVEDSPPPSPRPPPLRRSSSLAAHQQQEREREQQQQRRREEKTHEQQVPKTKYRTTALSCHPVDVAASHAADCITNAVLLVAESMVLRNLAMNALGRGFNARVFPPLRIWGTGQGLVAKALVFGEWGLMFALFQASWGVCTWIGSRWFEYGV
ncbi:hypothetical protein FN846DRAFT_104242 [Sphaerosporella brunnea]|uniref:Uncharacterized protein n=1 Tax=Sphaerosporella brunnea TaxID=1250544 RepID=A0A5J5ET80_9PEZI|nr:hypothetical protein FN846DRAFT_104242 [Sphaerosporella brunnea]